MTGTIASPVRLLCYFLTWIARGFQIHLWKKRDVFKNMISRQYGPNRTVPAKPIFSELKLNAEEIAETDFRFEALKPYLKPNPPSFDSAAK